MVVTLIAVITSLFFDETTKINNYVTRDLLEKSTTCLIKTKITQREDLNLSRKAYNDPFSNVQQVEFLIN